MALGYRTNSEDEVAKISHFYPCFNNQIKSKNVSRTYREVAKRSAVAGVVSQMRDF